MALYEITGALARVTNQNGDNLCDNTPCSSNPCQNNGLCTVPNTISTGFECTCSTGFTGFYCKIDIDECIDGELVVKINLLHATILGSVLVLSILVLYLFKMADCKKKQKKTKKTKLRFLNLHWQLLNGGFIFKKDFKHSLNASLKQ